MAIDDRELDQRLKDQLRMIEMGETLEDLNDPEEYEDEGGIRSLRKAPSIKMASETAEEEFQLELMGVINEYNDLKSKDDPAVRGISLDQYLDNYMSKKKMMEENRAMAMGGGSMRMAYGSGTEEIVKPSKSMQRDTTTGEGSTMFNMDDYVEVVTRDGPKFILKKDFYKKNQAIGPGPDKKIEKKAMGGIAGVL